MVIKKFKNQVIDKIEFQTCSLRSLRRKNRPVAEQQPSG